MTDQKEGSQAPRVKKCSKCGTSKASGDFYVRKESSDGLHPYCKACVLENQKAYRLKNDAAVKARKHAAYWADPGKHRARSNEDHGRNRDKRLAARKAARQKDPEKFKETQAAWRRANPDILKGMAARKSERLKQRRRRRREEFNANLHTVVIPPGYKRCNACRTIYTLAGFYSDVTKSQGVASSCKACSNARNDDWTRRNRERTRLMGRAWYSRNRGRARQISRDWRARNEEFRKLVSRRSAAKVRREHPDEARTRSVAYSRAKRKPPWVSWPQLWAVYRRARNLAKETGQEFHVDHCFSIDDKHGVCGLHCPANLQVLPRAENIRKSNRLPGIFSHMLWDPDNDNVHYPSQPPAIPPEVGEWEPGRIHRLNELEDRLEAAKS